MKESNPESPASVSTRKCVMAGLRRSSKYFFHHPIMSQGIKKHNTGKCVCSFLLGLNAFTTNEPIPEARQPWSPNTARKHFLNKSVYIISGSIFCC
ncbi:hypothetical protein AMECASPLE_039308 [Ameca splendens]|uniref:Uncharacterized protein n=1 Tax=Ameca splendens TaxID=208324 RepID=A0ABV0YJT0_9TELE